MKSLIICAALSLLTISGCKKDDTSNPKSTKDFILGDWKIGGYTSDKAIDWDGSGTLTTDGMSTDLECFKDNIISFKANGTYLVSEGSTKCDPSDPDILYEAPFELTYPSLSVDGRPGTITQLDNTTLKFTQSDTLGFNNEPVIMTYTLKR